MAVYFWASGLILSPQSHILKSLRWGLMFAGIHCLRSGMQAIGCEDGILEDGSLAAPELEPMTRQNG
ncbi:hypothetical protein TNCV_3324551 [Trichonephila clavipes]|nr:hypothetical protein TNCV_3324551 [Trichonephila clavipes]